MRKLTFVFLALLAACTPGANPLQRIGTTLGNAANGETRGPVEIFVKTNHPALIRDIRAGGGPTLTRAFDIANVPQSARAFQTLRLQSDLPLYASNLDALVVALMVVSG